MDDGYAKFVDFKTYCPLCKFADKSSTAEPCNTCLETGGRTDRSPIPIEFVKKERE